MVQLQLAAVWDEGVESPHHHDHENDGSCTALAFIQEPLKCWETLYDRFQRTGNLNDISEAISILHRAVETTPADDMNFATMLNNLGNSFLSRFEHTGDLGDLAEAISLQTRAVDLTPAGDEDLPSRLSNLGNSLGCRYQSTGDLSDISRAISFQMQGVYLTPEGHVHGPSEFNNLGRSYKIRFERTGNLSDLANAISAQMNAVQLTPEGHTDLPGYLMNLGGSLTRRFERKGDLEDIAEAISLRTYAVHLTPDGHAHLPSHLTNLGGSFTCRFERTGDLEDIAEAISLRTRAVHLTPDGHADLPSRLMNLGGSLTGRFERTGDLEDIAEAISLQTHAVPLTPDRHAHLPSHLMNLGRSFTRRFERKGDLEDIAEAISLQTHAVRLTPDGHAHLPSHLMNLGGSLTGRFERTGDLEDIAEAISLRTYAVHLTPDGHAHLPNILTNLANSFLSRFQSLKDDSDLSEAIALQTRAIELTPEPHASLPTHLTSLGVSLKQRFQRFGNLSDISAAIARQEQAVDATSEGHAQLPGFHTNLGTSFMMRFGHTHDPADAKNGISNLVQALQLTHERHANLPTMHINLAFAWYQYFTSSHRSDHLDAAISNFKYAATCTSGSPRTRLEGTICWAGLLNDFYPCSTSVLTAFGTALDLLTSIAGLEQTVQHRYTMVGEFLSIPGEAAAAAFKLSHPDRALEWLEQGRCLVWGQQSQLRTPLDALNAHDPALAARLLFVSQHLESAGSSRQHSSTSNSWDRKASHEADALKHSQLASERDRILGHIRAIPGFETFLQPLRCTAILSHLPRSGPVIVLNVHEDRCDAIALRDGSDEVLHIPLPSFTLQKAKWYQHILTAQLKDHRLRIQDVEQTSELSCGRAAGPYNAKARDVHDILEGLWRGVVRPTLDALGFLVDPVNALPRIWWCPTGPLSFLPLHAAGVYKGVQVESVADYVVSSYTPSVAALTQRIKNDAPIDDRVSGLFLTSQPTAPGAPRILGTVKEVSAIHTKAQELQIRALNLSGDAITPKECLERMEEYSSIHLACHGIQETLNPLRSRFLFHKGGLDLNSVMQKNLPNADLAYLSACQTSAGQESLPDEAVHLAAGMLAAGYRRVVSTMWEIGDESASQVASDFYQYLWSRRPEGSGSRFDGTLSAHALHYATQQLRDRLGNTNASLLAWIPFVHYGY
ncbi:hypothetical protein FA13DRAFT_1896456 [Coprinellus micaceus]|uniref:CHAT domain-containing protein n=1 Tax=Coprinellus micaceus TaxID=71717 RepID=A0A4Y7SW74_COPMI|nr:hypothetical protein FA13DRAFT_1896456 [Coprinellus micaceus]